MAHATDLLLENVQHETQQRGVSGCQHGVETVRVEPEQDAWLQRHKGGGSRLGVQQRHFTEHLTRFDDPDGLAGFDDLQSP